MGRALSNYSFADKQAHNFLEQAPVLSQGVFGKGAKERIR